MAGVIRRSERHADEHGAREDEGSHVRRAPVESGRGEGDDCESETSAADAGSAVQPLCAGSSDRGPDVLASRNESDTGSEPGDEPADDATGERPHEERKQVP